MRASLHLTGLIVPILFAFACGEETTDTSGSAPADAGTTPIEGDAPTTDGAVPIDGATTPEPPPPPCTKYVRAGASGKSDGSSWTDALPDLPQELERAQVYCVADGTYAGYEFDDDEAGTQTITVRKATTTDHGDAAGWDPSYGDGVAFWGPITFTKGHVVFDGIAGSGRSGHGFEMDLNVKTVALTVHASHVKIAHVRVHWPDRDSAALVPSRVVESTVGDATDVTVSSCYFHEIPGLPFYFIRGRNILVERTVVSGNHSDATWHAECASIRETSKLVFRHNWFEDNEGTGCIMAMSGDQSDWEIYGNVFSETGDPKCEGYGHGIFADNFNGSLTNAKFYNNTIVGMAAGGRAGLAFWATATKVVSANNLWDSCSTPVSNQGVTSSDHNFYSRTTKSNTEWDPEQDSEDAAGDPFVDSAKKDFRLAAPTKPGKALPAPYDVDATGKTRGADGNWDRGAFER